MYLDYGTPLDSIYNYKQILKEQWMAAHDGELEVINSPDEFFILQVQLETLRGSCWGIEVI